MLQGNMKPRPLWCGFGFVTNILQSLKTAFDDPPNFPFLSLIPVFLIALLCPTLKRMFPFPQCLHCPDLCPGFSAMPFLPAQGKCLHLQGNFLKSQFYNPFSHFCFSFLVFFLYGNTFQFSSSFPNFTAVLQEATTPFQLCNEMPQYLHSLNTLFSQSFKSFLSLIRYCSFLSFFPPMYVTAQYQYFSSTQAFNFYFGFHFVICCQYFISPSPQQRLYFSSLTDVCIPSKVSCKFNLFAA